MSTENIGLLFALAEKDTTLACQMSSLQGESVDAFVNRLVRLSEKVKLPFTKDELTVAAQAAIRGKLPKGLPTLPRASAYALN
jgi:hypothetical protein